MNSIRTFILGGVLALSTLLAACQPQAGRINLAADEKLQITPAVWKDYEAYLRIVGTKRGAFAVSESGTASGWSYCLGQRCKRDINFSKQAIEYCQESDQKCVVFARNSSIVVDYEIVD